MDDNPDRPTRPMGEDDGPVPRAPESPAQDERLQHFIRMLSDENEGNRWKAAEALGRIGDPGAVEPLIDTLWDDDIRVRIKAAWALGQIRDIRALQPLRRLYRMEGENAQEIIAEALEEIKEGMSSG